MSLPKHKVASASITRKGIFRIAIEGEPDLTERYGSRRSFSPQGLILEFHQDGPDAEVTLWSATLRGPQRLKGGGLSEARDVSLPIHHIARRTPEGEVVDSKGFNPFREHPDYVRELVREYWPESL